MLADLPAARAFPSCPCFAPSPGGARVSTTAASQIDSLELLRQADRSGLAERSRGPARGSVRPDYLFP